jgi:hypothetical protein
MRMAFSPFRLGDPSSFDGVSHGACNQSPPAGAGRRFNYPVSRRAACREVVAKAADPAKRLIGYGVNRSTIAFSQKAIDQSNECF